MEIVTQVYIEMRVVVVRLGVNRSVYFINPIVARAFWLVGDDANLIFISRLRERESSSLVCVRTLHLMHNASTYTGARMFCIYFLRNIKDKFFRLPTRDGGE